MISAETINSSAKTVFGNVCVSLRDSGWLWIAVGLFAYGLLPWFMQDTSNWLGRGYLDVFRTSKAASGFLQAVGMGKPWLCLGLVGIFICAAALALTRERNQARWLIVGGLLGLIGLFGSGFLIGMQGWVFDWTKNLLSSVPGQAGIGSGGFVALTALTILTGFGVARLGYFRGDVFVSAAVLGCSMLLLLFIVLPVGKIFLGGFYDDAGVFSVAALGKRLLNEQVWGLGCVTGGPRCGIAWNTLFLGLLTATTATILGVVLALMAERGAGTHSPRFEKSLRLLALLPFITPSFVVGLGLILLFGRAGLVNQFLTFAFDVVPSRWLYGVQGIWLAQTLAFTPIAFMIVRGGVQGVSPSLEEAAQVLRASPTKTFFSVTLPLLKPGLLNAFLVTFIESMADFGNPFVVGGGYKVLSTSIYYAVIGETQTDPGRVAALGMLLAVSALAVFALQRWAIGKAGYATVSGKGDGGIALPMPPLIKRTVYTVGFPWLAFTMVLYVFAIFGGFVELWGRDYTLTLRHYSGIFDVEWGQTGIVWIGGGWSSFWTTVTLASIAAPVTAFVALLMAFLISRTEFRGRGVFEFGALLAFAIPGTVVGLSYIMAFNVPPFDLTGTTVIILLCFLFRNLPTGVRAGVADFKQLDKSLDEASIMLRASTLTTLRRVTLPLLRPALIAGLVYSFVRATTTVSAVIFLVTPENQLATKFILDRAQAADYGGALAYCTVLMVLMLLSIGVIQLLVGQRRLGRRGTESTQKIEATQAAVQVPA